MLPWLPGFPPQAFPTITSFLTSPQSIFLQSTAAFALGLPHSPQTPAPNHCAFQGTCVPVQGMYGCSKDCLVLILFRLLQISCFTLSLQCFSSDPDNCPSVGIRPLLQFPHCGGQVKSCFSPLFPLSNKVFRGSIYSFPLVRYSYLLSAGVLLSMHFCV